MSSGNMQFVRATKTQSRLRMTIDGPSGSGKTYTSLVFATELARGRGNGRVALIDTERSSAAKYAPRDGTPADNVTTFDFDTLALDEFGPRTYIAAIHAAEEAGYRVIVIDSLSHAWEGEGGALDMVDRAAARNQGNSYTAWRDVTPQHRAMVDAILRSPAHIITTMRSKMEYVQERDDRTGKTIIRKVGLAPIQRQGTEYEFDIVADMDIDHRLVVSKSRCFEVADAVVSKPTAQWFQTVVQWLDGGAPLHDWGNMPYGSNSTVYKAALAGAAKAMGVGPADIEAAVGSPHKYTSLDEWKAEVKVKVQPAPAPVQGEEPAEAEAGLYTWGQEDDANGVPAYVLWYQDAAKFSGMEIDEVERLVPRLDIYPDRDTATKDFVDSIKRSRARKAKTDELATA